MKIIILNAGETRGHGFPLDNLKPKCLYHIKDKTILENQIDIFHSFGLHDIRIVVGWKKELIKNYCREKKWNIEFVENLIWDIDALESLRLGVKNVDDDKLIVLGDAILEREFIEKFIGIKASMLKGGSCHTIKLNKKIKISEYLDCCSIFLPKPANPASGEAIVNVLMGYFNLMGGKTYIRFSDDLDRYDKTDEYRKKNSIVGYAFVVGDLLHIGHLNFLRECKKYCNYLIVGVYSDELVGSYKREPIIPFDQRSQMISALREVDEIRRVEDLDTTPMMRQLVAEGYNLKCLFHGDDWKAVPGREYIESIGGILIQPKYTEGISSTAIITRILEKYGK